MESEWGPDRSRCCLVNGPVVCASGGVLLRTAIVAQRHRQLAEHIVGHLIHGPTNVYVHLRSVIAQQYMALNVYVTVYDHSTSMITEVYLNR